MFMEQPVEARFNLDRSVFALLLLFVMVLNMFLKSVITAELSGHAGVGRYRSLEELSRAGVTVGLSSFVLKTSLREATNDQPELAGLNERSHVCINNLTACLARFKVGGHKAVVSCVVIWFTASRDNSSLQIILE